MRILALVWLTYFAFCGVVLADDSDVDINDVPADEIGSDLQERKEECPGYPSCEFAQAAGGSMERAILKVHAAIAVERKQLLEESAMNLLPSNRPCSNEEDCAVTDVAEINSDDRWLAETPDGRGQVAVPASYKFVLENEPYLCVDSPDGDCSYENGDLPAEVDNRAIMKADILDLHDMDLTGTIPGAGLALVSEITSLDLSVNRLTGSIPDAIGLLSNLRKVKLSRNELQGWIPLAFGFLQSLLYFDVSVNQISGSFPMIFGQMPNLVTLNMGSNRLQGSLPDAMWTPWILLSEFEEMEYENSEIRRLITGGKDEMLGLSSDGAPMLAGTGEAPPDTVYDILPEEETSSSDDAAHEPRAHGDGEDSSAGEQLRCCNPAEEDGCENPCEDLE
mmetsp:Transcript_26653/g.61305  ORF Transcript_26653/g.61305 Transcript_26653/m.61305 type:complete len:392 (-) Transcript_26653:33-1208(-)